VENFVFLIPIFGMMIPLSAVWLKHRERIEKMRIEATAHDSAERAAQYVSRIAEMEDRIRVLERIVTDGGYNVATQIEALRDTRRVEQQLEAPAPKERV
jgi:hypothetical protein